MTKRKDPSEAKYFRFLKKHGKELPYTEAEVAGEAIIDQTRNFSEYLNAAKAYASRKLGSMTRKGPCRGTRVYVIVADKLLPPVQRAVQACHAVAGLMDKYGHEKAVKIWARRYKTIILLGSGHAPVDDIIIDEDYSTDDIPLKDTLKSYTFYEPDLKAKTAIAFYPITAKQGEVFFPWFDKLR